MRKWIEGFALLALGLQISITVLAFFGANHLPDRIPIHFDALGHPDRWGSPAMLLVLPAVTIISYLLLTVITQFPEAFNYPVKVTAFNRKRVQALALDMTAWLKFELLGLFTWIQWSTVMTARGSSRHIPSMTLAALVIVFTTVLFYIAAMFRGGREVQSLR